MPLSTKLGWESALNLACALGSKPGTTICALYVVEVERSLPLDAEVLAQIRKAEGLLSRAREMAAKQGYDIETNILQAREAGPAIVDEAAENGASLIVIGIGYKKRFGDFTFGQVAPHVLRHAACPVLLAREPVQ